MKEEMLCSQFWKEFAPSFRERIWMQVDPQGMDSIWLQILDEIFPTQTWR